MTESNVKSSTKSIMVSAEEELIQVLHVDDEAGFLKRARCIP